MNAEKQKYSDFKEKLVIEDWKIAYEMHTKHISQINNYRGWTVTLLLAYFGFLLTTKTSINLLLILPAFFIIVFFMMLEAFEIVVSRYIYKEIVDIESIFMTENDEERREKILIYKFRDLKIGTWFSTMSSIEKLKNMIFSLNTFDSKLWYGMLIISIILLFIVVR